MPRNVKKKQGKFRHNLKNRACYMRKLQQKKKKSKSAIEVIKKEWDTQKTPRENIATMGLAFDPNEAIPMKPEKRIYVDAVPLGDDHEYMDLQAARALGSVVEQNKRLEAAKRKDKGKRENLANKVISTIEKAAVEAEQKIKEEDRSHRLREREVELCIYLIERYADDYKAMSRDRKNLFQHTPKQLEKMIRIYKSSPYHQVIQSI